MENISIVASRRSVTGKQVGALRRQGLLPGILYGRHIQPVTISMDLKEATKVMQSHSSSALITIELEGESYPSLVREKQRDFIRGTLLHVDFQAVSLTEKIRTAVSIELFGSSPAVKDMNGLVYLNLDELEIECLPQDLPEMVRVDVSGLATIGSSIHVRDIDLGAAITIFDDPNEIIAVVNLAGKEEEEVAVVAEEVAAVEPEVIERGKKEEEAEE